MESSTKTIRQVLGNMAKKTAIDPNLIKAAGYNPGTCQPDCPICGGYGVIRLDVEPDDPRFGKLQPCPNINISLAPDFEQIYGLTPDEYHMGWDVIQPIDNAIQAVDQIRAVLERGYGLAYLWGGFGKGKTLLLKLATGEMIRQGWPAAFADTYAILDECRVSARLNPLSNRYEFDPSLRLDWWQRLKFLAVDEFDKINETGFATERAFALFNQRYTNAIRQTHITLIASNTKPDRLMPAIADRLADGRVLVIHLDGRSIRSAMTDKDRI